MKTKVVYCYNMKTGAYIGRDKIQESPREPGVFLFPKNATDIKPPEEVSEGYFLSFENGEWIEKLIPNQKENE